MQLSNFKVTDALKHVALSLTLVSSSAMERLHENNML